MTIPGVRFIWSPPKGQPIVGIIRYRDKVIVATSNAVYELREVDNEYIATEIKLDDELS